MNRLDVLLIYEGNSWAAQCLQYDIVAQGDTVKDAQRAFEYVLAVEAAYLDNIGKSLAAIPPAPEWCWKAYNEALGLEFPKGAAVRLPINISNLLNSLIPEQRELRLAA